MKTTKILTGIIIGSLVAFSFHRENVTVCGRTGLQDTASNYLDGSYTGQSQSIYTGEQFWGHIWIKVEGGAFTKVDFVIRDSSSHEVVDSMYGVIHYSGNPVYMQQCVNEEHGIAFYPQNLLESQNVENVDCYTGASAIWSHNIFVASAKDALKDAKKPSGFKGINQDGGVIIKVSHDQLTSSTVFAYYLPEQCHVNLSIYDIQGKLIKQLVNQEQPVGDHAIRWNDGSAEGIYCYWMKAGEKVISDKLIAIKK